MITGRGRGSSIIYSDIVNEHIIGPDGMPIIVPLLLNHTAILATLGSGGNKFAFIGQWQVAWLCTDQPTPENPQIAVNPWVICTLPLWSAKPNVFAARPITTTTSEWNSLGQCAMRQNDSVIMNDRDHAFDQEFSENTSGQNTCHPCPQWSGRGPKGYFCPDFDRGATFRLEASSNQLDNGHDYVQANIAIGTSESIAGREQVKGDVTITNRAVYGRVTVFCDQAPGQLIWILSEPTTDMGYWGKGHIMGAF